MSHETHVRETCKALPPAGDTNFRKSWFVADYPHKCRLRSGKLISELQDLHFDHCSLQFKKTKFLCHLLDYYFEIPTIYLIIVFRQTKPDDELVELGHSGLIPGGHCDFSMTSNKYLDGLEGEIEIGELFAVRPRTSTGDEVHFRLQVQLVDKGGGARKRWDRWTDLTGDRNLRCPRNASNQVLCRTLPFDELSSLLSDIPSFRFISET